MELTSVTCSIGLAEITYQARQIESFNSHAFEAFALATLLFLIVMLIMALPGLQARKVIGWQLLMLCNGINLAYGLLTGGIIGPILGALIGVYVLIQLRRYYM